MDTEETKDKGDKTKSADSGRAPTGHGMFELMSKCCAGQGGSTDCSTMMKGMMEAMRNHQPCWKEGRNGGKGGRNESVK